MNNQQTKKAIAKNKKKSSNSGWVLIIIALILGVGLYYYLNMDSQAYDMPEGMTQEEFDAKVIENYDKYARLYEYKDHEEMAKAISSIMSEEFLEKEPAAQYEEVVRYTLGSSYDSAKSARLVKNFIEFQEYEYNATKKGIEAHIKMQQEQ